MTRNLFQEYIKQADFRNLFITELGWNNYPGAPLPPFAAGGVEYELDGVAERNGFQVLFTNVEKMPLQSDCKLLDTKLRKLANDYILIFQESKSHHHLWVVPIKTNEKRQLVYVEYNTMGQTDFLYQKMDGLSFGLDEETFISDVKERVQTAFQVNSEKITKDFYAGFRKEHKSFVQYITGLPDQKDKEWYTSVMLNRLMFCYFVQKKGFLNLDPDYLQHKLKETQEKRGKNQFFGTFYKEFLLCLFHDGLNSPRHSADFEEKYGRIPYLNGGMFDLHELEKANHNINIEDEAFEHLFEFFDKWQWHLDTRETASGKDINPDVLGYIFEQYINDRAQMGAYYTKEDITEYIGKNCILPFLMDRLKETSADAFKANGYVWQTLRNSGDKYIYNAVKRGADRFDEIPEEIAVGLDTTNPNLLERRAHWNEKTPDAWALPTEIWRESIERMRRCREIKQKIANGEIHEINDFITYNLDIRSFCEDLLRNTEDHLLVKHFYEAMVGNGRDKQPLSILDPTCGSGAFLFAALNILEPLYEVCIERMQEFHETNENLFKEELGEIANKYQSNIQYFIYKSIILRNLYGVDIMVEATEIAKLRLFLKMVAVVEVDRRADNLGLDPLPDVDFNIRCGNTLVGYSTMKELERSFTTEGFDFDDHFGRVKVELQAVSSAYNLFRHLQLSGAQTESPVEYKEAKKKLNDQLQTLNLELDQKLYASASGGKRFEKWLSDTQPFHWLAEYYQIIQGNGGFDVIIGNPPYVEHSSGDVTYSLSHLKSVDCGNLYGNCIERGTQIGKDCGRFSFIIPVAITCSQRMEPVIKLLKNKSELITFANFDDRPGKLFEMIEHLRATIFIASFSSAPEKELNVYATKYNRWYTEHRGLLFNTIRYTGVTDFVTSFTIPKFSTPLETSINKKLQVLNSCIASLYESRSTNKVYYRAAGGGYFLLMKTQKSITYIDGVLEDVKAEKSISLKPGSSNSAIGALLSSSLFYWNYIAYTDCRNLTKSFIDQFPVKPELAADSELIKEGNMLFKDYENHKNTKNTTYKTTGRNVIYDEYYPKLSKNIIDSVDKIIGIYYGFTEEEVDFIVNFDYKYRLGDLA